ncbi:MAG: A24 family peptidase [Acidobacteriota bacterium]|nr:A24 family peptidase [Acidobacteriota bacterium]
MYPLIELATGLLFVGCYLTFGLTPDTFKWLLFVCIIVILTITDLRVRLLPDAVNGPGFLSGVIFAWFVPPNDGAANFVNVRLFQGKLPGPAIGIFDALIGAAFGSFLLWGAAALYKVVRGREGMGFGDVKMMAMVGAFLGLRGSFMTILLGTFLGSVLGLALIIALYAAGWKLALAERASRRGLGKVAALRWAIASQYQLPLGTFLGIGALAVVFFFASPTSAFAPRPR